MQATISEYTIYNHVTKQYYEINNTKKNIGMYNSTMVIYVDKYKIDLISIFDSNLEKDLNVSCT